MPYFLTIFHYFHQIILIKFDYPWTLISFYFYQHLWILLYLHLFFSEFKQTIISNKYLLSTIDFIYFELIIRIGWFLCTHVYIIKFEDYIFCTSFYTVLFNWIMLCILILLLIFSKRNAAVHCHQFRYKSIILFLDVEVSHYSIWTSMFFFLTFLSNSWTFWWYIALFIFLIIQHVLEWWWKIVERGLFFLRTWLISAIFLTCLR